MSAPKQYLKSNTVVLIDNGHGKDNTTKGKYSPLINGLDINENDATIYDGRYREGNCNRICAKKLLEKLKNAGIEAYLIVPEDDDIRLYERVRRINEATKRAWMKGKDVIFLSLHSNAAGSGNKWCNATGVSVHVAANASMWSKELAKKLHEAAVANGLAGNRSVPKDHCWVNNFYIIKNAYPPAVLTESLFYDNKDDLRVLTTDEGREKIATYLLAGILNFLR